MNSNSQFILDFSKHVNERTGDFTGREWIFKEIDKWLLDPNGPRYFIITGKAGTGKTAIASRLVQFSNGEKQSNLKSIYKGFLDAEHFCSEQENLWSDARIFSINLSRQLIQSDSEFADCVLKDNVPKIKNEMTNLTADTIIGIMINELKVGQNRITDVFNNIVRYPLEILSKNHPYKRITILVDALDEAKEDQESIVQLLANNKFMPKNIRFILTTRTRKDIETKFQNQAKFLHLSSKRNSKQNNVDLFSYINYRLQNDDALRNIPHLNPNYAYELSSKAAVSHFLYAKLILDAIAKKELLPDKDSLLKLPVELDDLYYEFLDRIASQDRKIWETEYEKILGLLSVSQKGLSFAQLSFFTGLPQRTVRNRLEQITPFIIQEKTKENLQSIKLYHQSIVEFLRNDTNRFYLPEHDYHKAIIDAYNPHCDWNKINWNHMDEYGLRYLPEHLLRASSSEPDLENSLFDLARNQKFMEQLHLRFPIEPDLSLKVMQYALLQASETDNATTMAEFVLKNSSLLHNLRQQSPIEVLLYDINLIEQSWKIADLYDIQTSVLWHLLIFWFLTRKGRQQEATKTIERLMQKKLDKIPKVKNLGLVFLLNSIYSISPMYFDNLCHRLIEPNDLWDIDNFLESVVSEQIQKTNYDEAISAASMISYPYSKAKALRLITTAQIQTKNYDAAAKTLNQILSVASKIENLHNKVKVLNSIISVQLQTKNYDAAIDTAAKIESSYDRVYTLRSIVNAQAQANDYDAAMETVSMLHNNYDKSKALSLIVSVQTKKNDYDAAMETASKIDMYSDRVEVLCSIANAQAQANDYDAASKTIDIAIKLASKIDKSHYDKTKALCFIASSQLHAINYDAAAKTLNQIILTISKINSPSGMDQILSSVANTQLQANDYDAAMETASKIDMYSDRLKMLYSIVNAQAQANDYDAASKTIDIAIKLASKIDKSHYDKTKALCFIASSQLQTKDYTASLETASKIRSSYEKAKILYAIANTQAQENDYDAAMETASRMEQSSEKIEVLSFIANAQAQANDYDAAMETASKADSSFQETDVLYAIAVGQLQEKDYDAAMETASRMVRLHEKSDVLCSVISAQLQEKDYDAAMETASKINNYSEESRALSLIVSAQAQEKDYDAAMETASKIKDSFYKTRALQSIAVVQSYAKDYDAAAKTLGAAIETVSKKDFSYSKAKALQSIATAQSGIKDHDTAAKTFHKAITIASKIKDSSSRSEALQSIAMAQIKIKDYIAAISTLSKMNIVNYQEDVFYSIISAHIKEHNYDAAIKTASKKNAYFSKAQALYLIVSAQAREHNYDAAIKTAYRINDFYFFVEALCSIAAAQMKTKNYNAADKIFHKAMIIASDRRDYSDRVKLLSLIAITQAKAKDYDAAIKTLDKAIEITINPNFFSRNNEELHWIAIAQLETKDYDAAMETASKIKDSFYISATLHSIAIAQLETKDYDAAMETASKIDHYSYKARTLGSIAQMHAKNFDAASKTFHKIIDAASKINSSSDKAKALNSIATVQVQNGMNCDAIETINMIQISRNYFLPLFAESMKEVSNKEVFKLVLMECRYYMDSAIQICGLLCCFYPSELQAIKKLIDVFCSEQQI